MRRRTQLAHDRALEPPFEASPCSSDRSGPRVPSAAPSQPPEDVWEPAVAHSLTRHRREVASRVALGEPPPSRVVRGAPLEPRIDAEHRLEVHDVREIRGRAPWAEPTDPGWTDHTGKGPRGWPSDARIHEVVCHEMLHDPDLDASDLEVACHEGEVTLTGWVRSREEKRLAEWIADRVRGVRDVHNRLVVR